MILDRKITALISVLSLSLNVPQCASVPSEHLIGILILCCYCKDMEFNPFDLYTILHTGTRLRDLKMRDNRCSRGLIRSACRNAEASESFGHATQKWAVVSPLMKF